jgi:phage protein U
MSIGLLTGVAKDKKQIDVVFEVYAALTVAENTYSLFDGKASITQDNDGNFAFNVGRVQVAGKNQQKTDMRVMTFNDFKRSSGGKWATHEVIGKKSKLEFISPGLEEISFSITLNVSLGVAPEAELVKLRQMRDEGTACVLIVGDKPVTDNLVVVQKVEEEHRYFDNKGNLLAAYINISLMEYAEDDAVEEGG